MFRGSAPTKIDDKGRLKIPTDFRRTLEQRWGTEELFITSVRGDCALVYPLGVWEEYEQKLLERMPASDPVREKFLERVNYFGQQARLDAQGRTVLPQILREAASMNGEVVVQGRLDHLVVWNHERFGERLAAEPFTDDDFRVLAERGL